MTRLFTKENMARLTRGERGEMMMLQMSPAGGAYSAGGYLPDDCSECGACGEPILGSGWCSRCGERFEELVSKAEGR